MAVLISLAATILGLSRFGYGVLLPSMREELNWSYAQSGLLDTANAVGYLAGALVCPLLFTRFDYAMVLGTSAAITSLSLFGCAFAVQLPVLVALRAVGGGASAALFVAGGLLASRLATVSARPGAVLGTYYAGVGPGILLTAVLIPAVLSAGISWRWGWFFLGLLAACCSAVAWRAARTVLRLAVPAPAQPTVRRRPLGWALAAFTLFGLGYVPFATFAVEYWQRTGSSTTMVTLLWALVAAAATVSGFLWRNLLADPGHALVVLIGVVAAGTLLPLISTAVPVLALSALLFGGGFLAVTAAATAQIRQTRPQQDLARTVSAFTVAFAAGQALGPVGAGLLADNIGLRGALAACTLVLALAATAAWRNFALHQPPTES